MARNEAGYTPPLILTDTDDALSQHDTQVAKLLKTLPLPSPCLQIPLSSWWISSGIQAQEEGCLRTYHLHSIYQELL